MHGFDGPAARDQRIRQVVEQLGMRRTLACLPEVAWGADDPFAEVPLPDPVGHHTRRQRIGSVSQPLSQFLAPAASYDRGLPVTGQNERKALWREVWQLLCSPNRG